MSDIHSAESEKSAEVQPNELSKLYALADDILEKAQVPFATVDLGQTPLGSRLVRLSGPNGESIQIGQHIINEQTTTEIKTLTTADSRSGEGFTAQDHTLEIVTQPDLDSTDERAAKVISFDYHKDTGIYVDGKGGTTGDVAGAMLVDILRGDRPNDPLMKHGLPTTEQLRKAGGRIENAPVFDHGTLAEMTGLLEQADPATLRVITEDIDHASSLQELIS